MNPHESCLKTFSYSPKSGELKRKDGETLGGTSSNGRLNCNYFGISKPATHVIWYYMTGSFPEKGMVIDHIDRIPSNNKWRNLRKITKKGNAMNKSVGYYKDMFTASVNVNSDSIFLGYFKTKEEAEKVMDAAYEKLKSITL